MASALEEPLLPSAAAAAASTADQASPAPQSSIWNWNTRWAFAMCLFAGVADSIWSDTVLSTFLYALAEHMGVSKDNTMVGLAEAASGISMLAFALPVGYLADKWSKSKTVQVGGVIMVFTAAFNIYAVDLGERATDKEGAKHAFIYLVVSMIFWGAISGVINGPAQAIFADSLPSGRRSEGYTYLFGAYLVSSAVGPAVGLVMFSQLSSTYSDWTLSELKPVFITGLALEIVCAFTLFFFVDVPPEAVEESTLGESTLLSEGDSTLSSQQPNNNAEGESWFYRRRIPLTLFLSSLVVSLGSGMTVKYFALFFKDCGMAPEHVQTMFVFSPLVIALFSVGAKQLGDRVGRIEAMIAIESSGTLLLFTMSLLHSKGECHPYVMIPIYVVRTGLMNCTYALAESVLMDYVPSNERSRWKSLESVASFGWAGSALVGGVISDSHGYSFAFFVTATMQLVGVWLQAPLTRWVGKEGSNNSPSSSSSSSTQQGASAQTTSPTSEEDLEALGLETA